MPDCPNHAIAMSQINEALVAAGLTGAEVAERVITTEVDAHAFGMHGSPTILIDGHDPFAEAGTPTSMSCRLYRSSGGFDGAPGVAELIAAIIRG